MDDAIAKSRLEQERRRVEQLIARAREDARSDRDEAGTTGDLADPAERMTAEGVDDAVLAGLEARLEAIIRAEERLAAGTYGWSVRSGEVIPDERLEADPAAELTVEEATE